MTDYYIWLSIFLVVFVCGVWRIFDLGSLELKETVEPEAVTDNEAITLDAGKIKSITINFQ